MEVNYFLSEKIPFTSQNKENEGTIQLIEVRNAGDKKATNVKVKIKNKVLDNKIIKNSEADKINVFDNKDAFELDYKELPVSGSFKLTIVTKGEGISQNEIEVSHSDGKAKNALETPQTSFVMIFQWFVIVLYLLLILREFFTKSLQIKARYNEQEQILKRSKPFYLLNTTWQLFRKEALNNFFHSYNFVNTSSDIQNSKPYKILSAEKPEYLSIDEWNQLKDNAIKNLKNEIIMLSNASYLDETMIIHLLKLERPISFPLTDWEDLMAKINKNYITMQKSKLEGLSPHDLKTYIPIKPLEIQQSCWDEYFSYYKAFYYKELIYAISQADKPLELLKEHDLSFLEPYRQSLLKTMAQNIELIHLPNLLNFKEANEFLEKETENRDKYRYYSALKNIAEQTIKLENQVKDYDSLIETTSNIVKGNKIPSNKPKNIDNSIWYDLERIYSSIQYIQNNEERFKEIEEGAKPLFEKAEKQLEIIHLALTDPSALNRIEEYSNVFAPGNFENLKKVVEVHTYLKRNTGEEGQT